MRKWLGKSRGTTPLKQSKLIEKEKNVIKVIYEAKGLWNVEVRQTADLVFNELQIPNAGQNLEPGEPSLPQEGLYVAIPDDATVTEIRVGKTKKKTYKLDYKVKPAPEPTTDPSGMPEINPKKEIYESDNAYPGVLFKNLGVKQLGDVKVIHLMMYPVQYYPLSNKIDLYRKIELEIEYELGVEKAPPLRGVPERSKRRIPAGYDDQILNIENI